MKLQQGNSGTRCCRLRWKDRCFVINALFIAPELNVMGLISRLETNPEYVQQLGDAVSHLSRQRTSGMVVFFPSFLLSSFPINKSFYLTSSLLSRQIVLGGWRYKSSFIGAPFHSILFYLYPATTIWPTLKIILCTGFSFIINVQKTARCKLLWAQQSGPYPLCFSVVWLNYSCILFSPVRNFCFIENFSHCRTVYTASIQRSYSILV